MGKNTEEKLNAQKKRYFIPTSMNTEIKGNALRTKILAMSTIGGLRESGDFPDNSFYHNRCCNPEKGDWRGEVSIGITFRVFNGTEWVTETLDLQDIPTEDIEKLGYAESARERLIGYKEMNTFF